MSVSRCVGMATERGLLLEVWRFGMQGIPGCRDCRGGAVRECGGMATNRGLLLGGMQGITGRGPCGAAVRGVAGMASKRGLPLGVVAVRLMSCCARTTPWRLWECRETFVELDARPLGVLSLFPDGSSSWVRECRGGLAAKNVPRSGTLHGE